MEKLYYSIYNAKKNMNWFATVLRVVICFIILTDLTEFSVEVLCGWSVRWSRMSRCEEKKERQELKLGDAQGTPSKYSRRLKHLSLGMPRKASPLSSTSIGMFSDSFRSCDMCNLGASFALSFHFSFTLPQSSLMYTPFERGTHESLFIRILYVLHLYILSLGIG